MPDVLLPPVSIRIPEETDGNISVEEIIKGLCTTLRTELRETNKGWLKAMTARQPEPTTLRTEGSEGESRLPMLRTQRE